MYSVLEVKTERELEASLLVYMLSSRTVRPTLERLCLKKQKEMKVKKERSHLKAKDFYSFLNLP